MDIENKILLALAIILAIIFSIGYLIYNTDMMILGGMGSAIMVFLLFLRNEEANR